jgi:hypothetical protein
MEADTAYFNRQITRYRIGHVVAIMTAAAVPVLAAVASAPRWSLGLLGAIAAVTEGIQGLFQFRRSGLNAMKKRNELERALNRYLTAVDPYAGPAESAFPVFVADIEAIRKAADEAFLQTWQASTSLALPSEWKPQAVPSPTRESRH